MTLRDYAQYYAAAYNWFLFPLEARGKHPITAHGFKDATNDLAQIARWWTAHPDANIGLDCGRSHVAVIDLDGAEGIVEWNSIADTMSPRGVMVQYTGGGGAHLIYRQPAVQEIRNTTHRLAPHIDTRGTGGYILLAPSVHPSGNLYAWAEGYDEWEKAEVFPSELLPRLYDPPAAKPALSANPPPNLARTLQRAYERIANASQGQRNEVINKAAWYLFGLVREGQLRESDVTDTILQAARRCQYPDRETIAILKSVAAHR
jgi:hypothetical protein